MPFGEPLGAAADSEVPQALEVCLATAAVVRGSASSSSPGEEAAGVQKRAWVGEGIGNAPPRTPPNAERPPLRVFPPQRRDRRQRSFVFDKVFLL